MKRNVITLTAAALLLSACMTETEQVQSAPTEPANSAPAAAANPGVINIRQTNAALSRAMGVSFTDYNRSRLYLSRMSGGTELTGAMVLPTTETQVIYGDADLKVNFSNKTMTGTVTRLGLFRFNPKTPKVPTLIEPLSGRVTLSDGVLSQGTSIEWTADVAGTLVGSGNKRYVVAGSLSGSVGRSTTSSALIGNGPLTGTISVTGASDRAGAGNLEGFLLVTD